MNDLRKKYVASIYITLWCVYNLQGILFTSGGMFSQVLLALVLAWSLYYFLIANLRFRLPKVMKVATTLVVAWMVYGVINIIRGSAIPGVESYFYLKGILVSMVPIYAFYVFTMRGWLSERIMTRWLYVFLLVALAQHIRQEQETLVRFSRFDEITNNSGYTVLSVITLLPLLYRKPLFQYVILAVIMYFVLQSYKRGAILAGVVCSVFFLYEAFRSNRQAGRKVFGRQVLRIMLTVGVVVLAIYAVQQTMATSDYFNDRIEDTREGNSSLRDEIYSEYYSLFFNQPSILAFLFGNGGDATLRLLGIYAHNDWLEIAINNGLWMVILYAVYWLSMIKHTIRLRKNNTVVYMMMMSFFIIYFLRTTFSMSYNDITVYAACAFGYALAGGDHTTITTVDGTMKA